MEQKVKGLNESRIFRQAPFFFIFLIGKKHKSGSSAQCFFSSDIWYFPKDTYQLSSHHVLQTTKKYVNPKPYATNTKEPSVAEVPEASGVAPGLDRWCMQV